ncbi:MAG: division/cell wall cluster transcriptional repressor MraZ [Pseudomonadota bacterium]|nr:division/cell wall cluster transcriptional repressor MraZ [Pseudomonadota bacterium]
MSAFGGYSGQAYSPAGDKGRFVLPPEFRNAIKESSDGAKTLCIARHHEWNCLVGFGLGYEAQLEDQLAHEEEMAVRSGKPFDRDRRRLSLFSYRKVPFDDSGRFIMPGALVKRANIQSGLFFNGMGKFFTIWSPEQLEAEGADFEDLLMDCEDAIVEAEAKSRKRKS